MKKYIFFLALVWLMIACSSEEEPSHFISDKDYRQHIQQTFDSLYKVVYPKLPEALAWVGDTSLQEQEKEAMQFLYVSMPLSDVLNRDYHFYLRQLRSAFKSKDLFAWAKALPEEVFRHFVLPYRINNENMDSARLVFQQALYPRIKDMSMEEAALEVNHWCHEKVNYRATDIRTISPLNAIKTAYGRCGEESTFTVTALRAVGIPARQVYTPRWAHTDDNHAWVEVYVDGKWQYLGACEPKPLLNTAWFDEPVLRAMMVHTKAFGKYFGQESVLRAQERYSILHLLSNYVEVKELFVTVLDADSNAVPEADIAFGLYNYAEFYPLKTTKTNAQGMASLVSGLGSLRITASSSQGFFNTLMVNLAEQDSCCIVLDKKVGAPYTEQLMHVPPIQQLPKSIPTDKEAINQQRLLQEDSIRNGYIATFYTKAKALSFLAEQGISDEAVADILVTARGNYAEIESYLKQAMSVNKKDALPLLKSLVQKDYHDITADKLLAHLKAYHLQDSALLASSYPVIQQYILNPRIDSEEITAFRSDLQSFFADVIRGKTTAEVAQSLKKWIETHITIDDTWNYYHLYMHPVKVCQLGIADKASRQLLYVAAMRSLGYAARIEQARRQLQYYDNAQWVDVNFADHNVGAIVVPKATLSLDYKGEKPKDPRYRIHFALAKFNGQFFETLEYDWEKPLSAFDKTFEVEAGYYQLLTGNRLHDGRVVVRQQFFNINEGDHYSLEFNIPEEDMAKENLGQWAAYAPISKQACELVGWINPESEPGKHFLADFKAVAPDYVKAHQSIRLYVATEAHKKLLMQYGYNVLQVEVDQNYALLADLYKDLGIEGAYMLPVFVLLSPDKVVRLHTKGYNIGTPAQLLKYMQVFAPTN